MSVLVVDVDEEEEAGVVLVLAVVSLANVVFSNENSSLSTGAVSAATIWDVAPRDTTVSSRSHGSHKKRRCFVVQEFIFSSSVGPL